MCEDHYCPMEYLKYRLFEPIKMQLLSIATHPDMTTAEVAK